MKKYKCIKCFPDFMWSFNGKVTECPGRKEGEIFNVIDMKEEPYKILLKNNYIIYIDI